MNVPVTADVIGTYGSTIRWVPTYSNSAWPILLFLIIIRNTLHIILLYGCCLSLMIIKLWIANQLLIRQSSCNKWPSVLFANCDRYFLCWCLAWRLKQESAYCVFNVCSCHSVPDSTASMMERQPPLVIFFHFSSLKFNLTASPCLALPSAIIALRVGHTFHHFLFNSVVCRSDSIGPGLVSENSGPTSLSLVSEHCLDWTRSIRSMFATYVT